MCTILYYIMFLCIICHCSNKLFHIFIIFIYIYFHIFKFCKLSFVQKKLNLLQNIVSQFRTRVCNFPESSNLFPRKLDHKVLPPFYRMHNLKTTMLGHCSYCRRHHTYWVSHNLPQICTAFALVYHKFILKQMQYRFAVNFGTLSK